MISPQLEDIFDSGILKVEALYPTAAFHDPSRWKQICSKT